MIPPCFSQPNNISNNSQLPQNFVTCIYQTQLCNSPTYLTLTWSKTLYSHTLTVYSADSFSVTISINPSTFSFFRHRPGSKSVHSKHGKIKLHWDFTRTKFNPNSSEPESSFYIAISCNGKVEFFQGDLSHSLTRRTGLSPTRKAHEPILLSRREHVFGHRNYSSQAHFLGSKHEIAIECDGGVLKVKVDGQISLVVKRLPWKFRGNEKIYVGGNEVEFYWDVFNWVNDGKNNGNGNSHGVFVFQVGEGGVWPEMVGQERRFMRKSLSASASGTPLTPVSLSPATSCSSVLQWAEESSDCGRSSCSSSTTRSCGSSGGFSLLLYAWRRD